MLAARFETADIPKITEVIKIENRHIPTKSVLLYYVPCYVCTWKLYNIWERNLNIENPSSSNTFYFQPRFNFSWWSGLYGKYMKSRLMIMNLHSFALIILGKKWSSIQNLRSNAFPLKEMMGKGTLYIRKILSKMCESLNTAFSGIYKKYYFSFYKRVVCHLYFWQVISEKIL